MSNHDRSNHDRRIMSDNPGVYIAMKSAVKEVYRKIMSEIHFVSKTRYEDLTEIGS